MSVNEKVKIHESICLKLNKMYADKNHDYGDSYAKLRRRFPKSIVIRLNDKIMRLETLMDKGSNVKSESIEDTLMDIANYCIMELVERKNTVKFVWSTPFTESAKQSEKDIKKDIKAVNEFKFNLTKEEEYTNGDYIRDLDDEGIARFILSDCCDFCESEVDCCIDSIVEWLKKPADKSYIDGVICYAECLEKCGGNCEYCDC